MKPDPNSFMTNHKITNRAYTRMLDRQHGRCAICARAPWELPGKFKDKRLVVDHNHACCAKNPSCGQCVRGLLCAPCNYVLGWAHDDPTTLRLAAEYLEWR